MISIILSSIAVTIGAVGVVTTIYNKHGWWNSFPVFCVTISCALVSFFV